MPRASKAAGSVALVTGANRGIGLAFVRELAARGARKIYAGVRSPGDITDEFKGRPASGPPVEVVPLDITDLATVQAAGAHGGGYIANVLSVAGAFPAPFMGGYSPAKAAALFLSSITRSELADQGTEVIALIVGSVDTRMAAHVQGRKEDPADIARAGLDALDRGEHVADTDFMAVDARARYARDPIRYERGMTKLLKVTTMDTGR